MSVDHDLANLIFGPLLAFVRISSLVMVLPFMGAGSVPAIARIGLAAAVAAIVVPLIGAPMPTIPGSVLLFALMILREILVGLTLGWLTTTILLSLPVAGQIVSYQMGLSSVLLPSSTIGPSSTLLSGAFNVALPPVVFATGLFFLPIAAILRSFHVIPLDAGFVDGRLPGAGLVLRFAVRAVAGEFSTAVQLAAPFLLVGLIWQAGLALMAKAAPNLQIFFAAAPMQLLGGMVLLGMLVMPMFTIWHDAMLHLLRAYASW